MKIRYSPHYDAEIFVQNESNLMGVIYVGTQKLLEQLELRAAMSQETVPDVEREAAYLNAMRKHIPGTLFEKSAKVDEIGVARELLQWRDALLMAGWDGKCDCPDASKLLVLAAIEQDFNPMDHSMGHADRWRAVSFAYSKRPILRHTEISVECPWSELPRLVQLTLEGIGRHGNPVHKMEGNEDLPNLDPEKISVIEFADLNEAYEWISSANPLSENTVVINRNNVRLNHILYTWDKARVSATLHESNPQVVQLFKLGMSIFSRPLNVQNVISYLLLPLSPIPDALRKDLATQLLKEGGFGEIRLRKDRKSRDEWEEKIAQYSFPNHENDFLTPIRNDYSAGVPKEDLTNYLGAIQKWLSAKISETGDDQQTQLHELMTFFKSLETVLQQKPDTLQYTEIEMLVRGIYRPISYAVQEAEQGSMNVISDLQAMAQPADLLIWLDCQAEDRENDKYDFLSGHERDFLSAHGVLLPDFQQHLRNVRQMRLQKLCAVKKVVLVKSDYDGLSRLSEHSLIAELRQICSKAGKAFPVTEKEKIFDTKTCYKTKKTEHFAPEESYEVGELAYTGQTENNHSLDTLINYPFDYVMQYVAKLDHADEEQVNNTFLTLGYVAHNFFAHIIQDSEGQFDIMRRKAEDEFSARLNAAIDAKGLILRLPENAADLEQFAEQLKESILALVDIMEHLKLSPVSCEIVLPAEDGQLNFDGIGNFGARIDLLLIDEKEEYAVFDFKWGYSKRHTEQLKKNIALQLELYRQAVRETYLKNVRGVGYYIMSKKKLITSDWEDIPESVLIESVKKTTTNPEALFEQIKRSYKFRMDELNRGHIEEAEELDPRGVESCYYAQQEKLGLCPLSINDQTKGKKSNSVFRPSRKPKYHENKSEPAEIPTRNAILKGRLK